MDRGTVLKKTRSSHHFVLVYGDEEYKDDGYVTDSLENEFYGFQYNFDVTQRDNVLVTRKGLIASSMNSAEATAHEFALAKSMDSYMFAPDDMKFFNFLQFNCDVALLFITNSKDYCAQSLLSALQRFHVPYSVYNNEK